MKLSFYRAAAAVVPAPPWWTVDPQTGCVLGRQAGGRGQALTENQVVTNLIGMHVCMISPIWDAFKGKGNTQKGGLKIGLAMLGCIIGMNCGLGGAFKSADSIAMFWAIFSAVFAVGDKLLDD